MDEYLRISKAADLENKWDRAYYRFLEMLPGILSWGTLIGLVVLSIGWKFGNPWLVSIFIIIFDANWLFKSVYYAFNLKGGYDKMAEYSKVNWLQKLQNDFSGKWEGLYHLVILPMYNEPYEVVRESFISLSKAQYPKDKFIVVLACEEKARKNSEETAKRIEAEFGNIFFKYLTTWHPANLPEEIPGKASNETWAAKKSKELLEANNIAIEKAIVSSFDVDTVVYDGYFACLTHNFLSVDNPYRTSFQPIPLFTNNIDEASAISRVFSFSTSFWQMISQDRMDNLITFSSHSMSFKALVDVGFKQTNIVSDDSRIFWQCFLKYDGDYTVCPLYYPVCMDANVAPSLWLTLKNIYKQQRRWAYGCNDIAYFLFAFSKNKKIKLWEKLKWTWELINGHWSWACASAIIFAVGWLPIFFGGPEFNRMSVAFNLAPTTSVLLTISMIGLFWSAYYSGMMLKPAPTLRGNIWNRFMILVQWLLVPFIMVFFTSVPAIDAQTRLMLGKYMGFWVTPKSR